MNLAENATYSQAEIDNLIKNAKQEDSTVKNQPAEVKVVFNNGVYTASGSATSSATVKGERAHDDKRLVSNTAGEFVGVTGISLKANKYGADNNVTI
ncbi:MAG: flagellar hook protein, partial [Lachnospiraceae bacterium]|nr:flagellar hook protein [Lachnospiraceae bacterium]